MMDRLVIARGRDGAGMGNRRKGSLIIKDKRNPVVWVT